MSNFIFLRNWVMVGKTQTAAGQTAYMLDADSGSDNFDDMIAASTSAQAASLVMVADKKGTLSIPGMKKKRYIGADVLWGAA